MYGFPILQERSVQNKQLELFRFEADTELVLSRVLQVMYSSQPFYLRQTGIH